MPLVPSNRDKKQIEDVHTIVYETVVARLGNHIKGKNAAERIHNAAADIVSSISHLLTVREDVNPSPIGATIMTPSASANKKPGCAPRNI